MSGEITAFSELPVGAHFTCNGNHCVKRSTATARLVDYNRTFYFRKTETVVRGYAGLETA